MHVFQGRFPGGSDGKASACNAGDPGSIPGLGRSPGEGIGYPFQCSWASLVAHMVKNLPAMWEIWVQSLGWEDPQRREWLPTPVFLPREFHEQRSLVGYSPWVAKSRRQLSNFHFHCVLNGPLVIFQVACSSGLLYKTFPL